MITCVSPPGHENSQPQCVSLHSNILSELSSFVGNDKVKSWGAMFASCISVSVSFGCIFFRRRCSLSLRCFNWAYGRNCVFLLWLCIFHILKKFESFIILGHHFSCISVRFHSHFVCYLLVFIDWKASVGELPKLWPRNDFPISVMFTIFKQGFSLFRSLVLEKCSFVMLFKFWTIILPKCWLCFGILAKNFAWILHFIDMAWIFNSKNCSHYNFSYCFKLLIFIS